MSTDRAGDEAWAAQIAMAEANDIPQMDPPFPPDRCRGETCRFVDGYDSDTLDPVGPCCGRVVTQVIYWRDRSYSPCCEQHGIQALDDHAIQLVRCIAPIEAFN